MSKDITIGVLTTTAVILLVGLVIVTTRPDTAQASGMVDSGGDYILLVGEVRDQEESLYVIDTGTDRLISYRFNINEGRIDVRGGVDLGEKMAGPDKPSKARRGRRTP